MTGQNPTDHDIPTNTVPGAMVTVADTDCPDQYRILGGHHEAGEAVSCHACGGEHTIADAVPVHVEVEAGEIHADDEIGG